MSNSLQAEKLKSIKRRVVLARVDDVTGGVALVLGDSASTVNGSTLTTDSGSRT